MVNSGNFFGARGRAADPMSDRQLAMRCKERGLVFDRETKSCRESRRGAGLDRAREARRQKRGDGPTMAQLRAECKARGLTLDVDTKSCRESRRGAGLDRAREARRQKRGGAMTIAQLRAECKARGLVLDKDTKSCRAAARRLGGLEAAYKRGSLFFGMSNVMGNSGNLSYSAANVSAGTPRSNGLSGSTLDLTGTLTGALATRANLRAQAKDLANAKASAGLGGMDLGNQAGNTIVLDGDGNYITSRGIGYRNQGKNLSPTQQAQQAQVAGLLGSASSVKQSAGKGNAITVSTRALQALMKAGLTRPEATSLLMTGGFSKPATMALLNKQ